MSEALRLGSETKSLRLRAPAKVNFGLRIRKRRDDGYHELESLFLPLDLSDEIEVRVAAQEPGQPLGIPLTVLGGASEVPTGPDNLVVRAARAFVEVAKLQVSLELRLEKRIPTGAGLGGGSSDAAAVLRGLDQWFLGMVSREDLERIAVRLGADVPFFLQPKPAWVSGIGERICPVDGISSYPLLLVNPGTPLATSEVYGSYDRRADALTPWDAGSTMRAVFAFQQRPRGRELEALLQNDLEPAARALCPAIEAIRSQLCARGAMSVGMSGSGATMFGVFEDEDSAYRAQSALVFPRGYWAQVVNTMAA